MKIRFPRPGYGFFRVIKYAWQRVVRGFGGYDDRILWEFDSWFYQVRPAIKKFLEYELEDVDEEREENNSERFEVYRHTLDLILRWEELEAKEKAIHGQYPSWDIDELVTNVRAIEAITDEFWGYFGEHIRWYWN